MQLSADQIKALGLKRVKDQDMYKSENFIKIYANNVQMGISMWDMHLTFGEIVDEKDGRPQVEQKVKVNMSKEFLKALCNLMTVNIARFEERNGPIQIISDFAIDSLQSDENPDAETVKHLPKKSVRKPKALKS